MASFLFPSNPLVIQPCSRLTSNCDDRLLSIGHPPLLTKNTSTKSLSSTTIHQEDMSNNLNRNLSPSTESIATSLTFNDDEVSKWTSRMKLISVQNKRIYWTCDVKTKSFSSIMSLALSASFFAFISSRLFPSLDHANVTDVCLWTAEQVRSSSISRIKAWNRCS